MFSPPIFDVTYPEFLLFLVGIFIFITLLAVIDLTLGGSLHRIARGMRADFREILFEPPHRPKYGLIFFVPLVACFVFVVALWRAGRTLWTGQAWYDDRPPPLAQTLEELNQRIAENAEEAQVIRAATRRAVEAARREAEATQPAPTPPPTPSQPPPTETYQTTSSSVDISEYGLFAPDGIPPGVVVSSVRLALADHHVTTNTWIGDRPQFMIDMSVDWPVSTPPLTIGEREALAEFYLRVSNIETVRQLGASSLARLASLLHYLREAHRREVLLVFPRLSEFDRTLRPEAVDPTAEEAALDDFLWEAEVLARHPNDTLRSILAGGVVSISREDEERHASREGAEGAFNARVDRLLAGTGTSEDGTFAELFAFLEESRRPLISSYDGSLQDDWYVLGVIERIWNRLHDELARLNGVIRPHGTAGRIDTLVGWTGDRDDLAAQMAALRRRIEIYEFAPIVEARSAWLVVARADLARLESVVASPEERQRLVQAYQTCASLPLDQGNALSEWLLLDDWNVGQSPPRLDPPVRLDEGNALVSLRRFLRPGGTEQHFGTLRQQAHALRPGIRLGLFRLHPELADASRRCGTFEEEDGRQVLPYYEARELTFQGSGSTPWNPGTLFPRGDDNGEFLSSPSSLNGDERPDPLPPFRLATLSEMRYDEALLSLLGRVDTALTGLTGDAPGITVYRALNGMIVAERAWQQAHRQATPRDQFWHIRSVQSLARNISVPEPWLASLSFKVELLEVLQRRHEDLEALYPEDCALPGGSVPATPITVEAQHVSSAEELSRAILSGYPVTVGYRPFDEGETVVDGSGAIGIQPDNSLAESVQEALNLRARERQHYQIFLQGSRVAAGDGPYLLGEPDPGRVVVGDTTLAFIPASVAVSDAAEEERYRQFSNPVLGETTGNLQFANGSSIRVGETVGNSAAASRVDLGGPNPPEDSPMPPASLPTTPRDVPESAGSAAVSFVDPYDLQRFGSESLSMTAAVLAAVEGAPAPTSTTPDGAPGPVTTEAEAVATHRRTALMVSLVALLPTLPPGERATAEHILGPGPYTNERLWARAVGTRGDAERVMRLLLGMADPRPLWGPGTPRGETPRPTAVPAEAVPLDRIPRGLALLHERSMALTVHNLTDMASGTAVSFPLSALRQDTRRQRFWLDGSESIRVARSGVVATPFVEFRDPSGHSYFYRTGRDRIGAGQEHPWECLNCGIFADTPVSSRWCDRPATARWLSGHVTRTASFSRTSGENRVAVTFASDLLYVNFNVDVGLQGPADVPVFLFSVSSGLGTSPRQEAVEAPPQPTRRLTFVASDD